MVPEKKTIRTWSYSPWVCSLQGLQVVGEEKDTLKEIRCGMETEDQEEVVVKAVKELKKSPAKSVKSSEWSMENSLLYY